MAKNGNGKLTREQLIAAAEELNKEVVPQPQIDLEADDGLLKSQIKEAAGIMVPEEDIVSPETQVVIDAVEADDSVIPTIDGEPQGEPEPAPTEPKGEDKTKEDDEGKEEDLVNLIKVAERIKELKPIVETKEKFKSLRKKMAEGAYRKEGGLEELKDDMLGLLGIGKGEDKKQTAAKKGGNGKSKTTTTSTKKKKEPVDRSTSNKAIIYTAWKDGEKDVEKLAKLVKDAVKSSTIKGWVSAWSRGTNLPAIAKK